VSFLSKKAVVFDEPADLVDKHAFCVIVRSSPQVRL